MFKGLKGLLFEDDGTSDKKTEVKTSATHGPQIVTSIVPPITPTGDANSDQFRQTFIDSLQKSDAGIPVFHFLGVVENMKRSIPDQHTAYVAAVVTLSSTGIKPATVSDAAGKLIPTLDSIKAEGEKELKTETDRAIISKDSVLSQLNQQIDTTQKQLDGLNAKMTELRLAAHTANEDLTKVKTQQQSLLDGLNRAHGILRAEFTTTATQIQQYCAGK